MNPRNETAEQHGEPACDERSADEPSEEMTHDDGTTFDDGSTYDD